MCFYGKSNTIKSYGIHRYITRITDLRSDLSSKNSILFCFHIFIKSEIADVDNEQTFFRREIVERKQF